MRLEPQTRADLIETLRKELPTVFARAEVPNLLGGMIAAGTLANLDSAKSGPAGTFRMGRKVIYRRDPFLVWLGDRLSRV